MFGTMFCQYETPCGWCVRLNKECTEKRRCKPKKSMAIAEENEILSEEAKKAGWKSGVAPLVGAWIEILTRSRN